ncbi:MAG: MFS transporter [Betaproteobacteria bacterium]|nr:MAG: MFS transporter [Betaproteobacteria bacterium]
MLPVSRNARRAVRARERSMTKLFNGLWRNGDFVRLWTSLTITHFGGQITLLALPLTAALLLEATPFEMGILTALEAVPFALFGLFAGVLVDRAPKLPLIVWSDLARGAALLAVPCAAWAGVLSMGVLYAVGFLIGTGSVMGWPAYQVFMTERVGRERLAEANAKIAFCDSARRGIVFRLGLDPAPHSAGRERCGKGARAQPGRRHA